MTPAAARTSASRFRADRGGMELEPPEGSCAAVSVAERPRARRTSGDAGRVTVGRERLAATSPGLAGAAGAAEVVGRGEEGKQTMAVATADAEMTAIGEWPPFNGDGWGDDEVRAARDDHRKQ